MDRISDEQLDVMIDYALEASQLKGRPLFYAQLNALIELRERRKAEQHVVRFQWKCRCGFVNKWAWPRVEYDDWVPTTMECDKCHEYRLMHERPEVIL